LKEIIKKKSLYINKIKICLYLIYNLKRYNCDNLFIFSYSYNDHFKIIFTLSILRNQIVYLYENNIYYVYNQKLLCNVYIIRCYLY